jgi:hypothetical protein
MKQQHVKRPDHRPSKYNQKRLLLALRPVLIISGRFADFLGFAGEEHGRVGLGKAEQGQKLHDRAHNGGHPEDPAPVEVFGSVGANDGGDGWGDEGEDAVDSLAFAPLFFAPGIG